VLKNVKLPFLNYKRINLPFEMNRILLVIALFFICCFTACTKSSLFGPAQYKAQAKADDSTVSKYIRSIGLTGKFKHVQNNDTIGVFYMIVDPSTTNTLYTTSTQVTVGDTGRYINKDGVTETLFYETNAFNPSYTLASVIPGWQLGIPECNVGGEIRLIIPSRYAYGPYAQKNLGLPANAVLDFYIRIYSVTN
jgi:FKBP-type peptidyl-prolyl cis-trans isomerase FkpA